MKSRNYFSLVLFFILFTFGCTDLYKKDVNTDLEFKIQIPKTRNAQTEAETLKLVVKLSYKDEDTSFEKIVYSTSEKIEKITFQNVEVGSEIKISASVFDTENLLFFGETEYKKVEPTNNIFTLTLEKVYVEPEIINARLPEITIPLNSIVELATPDSADSIEKQISIGATVSDGGDISFQWQKKVNNAWQNIDGIDEDQVKQNNITERKSHLKITIEKGNTQYYRCIITNTNENANGEKTASITSDEATVAYFEGELSIKATYNSEEYEIFEQEFLDDTNSYDYSVIDIEETYSFSNGETKIFQTQFSSEKYSIAKTNEAEKAIGYVQYTVTYKETSNSEDPISTTLYVPVKYDLSKATFSIVNSSNSVETFIPQYTGEETLQTQLSFSATSGFDTIHLYNSENTSQPSEYQIENDIDISWLSNSSIITNSEAGTFVYTATATSKENAWCFGSISSNHTVTVCPWEIKIKDGKNLEDLTANKDNLDGYSTYTLSVTNEAEEKPSVTWTSNNDDFTISTDLNQLSTPEAGENAQTATITATVGQIEVASIVVTVAAIEYGTETNPITDWSMLARKIENTGGDIYISGEMIATEKITVENETNIIAAKPVTITRDTSFTDTMFTVDETFTMQGTSGNTITIDGNNINATNTIISSNNISLSYVYIQNCYSSEMLGTAISVNKGAFSLQNSIFKNNSFSYSSILFDGSTIEAEINDCSFEDSIQDLQIYDANSVSISNTLFSQDNYDNLVIKKCNALTLGENILIPNIFYQNYATTSELNIICSDITLNNIDTPITIKLSYYTGTEYDLNLFDLQNGETVPENIFTLADENYVIGSDGSLEEVSSGDTYSQGDTYIESISINDKSFDYTKMIVVLDKSTTITGNENYYSGYYTSGDTDYDPETYKGCFYEDQSIPLQPFALGQYEVTQELFSTIMGAEHEYTFKDEKHPAHDLNWYMAIAFCNKLSLNQQIEPYYTVKDSQGNTIDFETLEYSSIPTSSENTWTVTENNNSGYRLPTEMEWEFAARGGDPNSVAWNYAFPGTDNYDKTTSINNIKGDSNLDNYAYYDDSYSANVNEPTTYEVGQKQPNTLGLYDMAGNVREWCNNQYFEEGYKSYRGGAYDDYAYQCCVSYRNRELPHVTNSGSSSNAKYGFRLCRTITN